jgi:hypothetical protein
MEAVVRRQDGSDKEADPVSKEKRAPAKTSIEQENVNESSLLN